MDKGNASNALTAAFIGRPTIFDMGIGILYFFTSHMVIRALYYVGVDRSVGELSLFFLIVIAFTVLAHVLARLLLRARLLIESTLGIPAVSVVAALGATLALVSMLPVVGIGLFYLSGALLGLACGWIIVIWTSTIHASRPDSNSFYLDPSLIVAVISYFLFRIVSTFSETIAQGFLLALPLVAIVCIIQGGKDGSEDGATIIGERAQALQVLVVVAAAFAIGCSVVVYLSGRENDQLASGLNNMVFFEVLAVALMVFCCGLMSRFAKERSPLGSRKTALLTFCVCYLPMFSVGILMGGAGIPSNSPDALWESNIWVLIIAIFAYDIRHSPYAVKGLAVGLMFEAMCIGQLIARVSTLQLSSYSALIAVVLAALYFTSICWQFFHVNAGGKSAPTSQVTYGHIRLAQTPRTASTLDDELLAVDEKIGEFPTDASLEVAGAADEGVPADIMTYCQKLAQDSGLTPREAEILALIALGRSAKYIAEELVISYNTTRTHIRHVYEKLNIHSKQELIDLVLFGSGLM